MLCGALYHRGGDGGLGSYLPRRHEGLLLLCYGRRSGKLDAVSELLGIEELHLVSWYVFKQLTETIKKCDECKL